MNPFRLFISQLCLDRYPGEPHLLVDTAYTDAARITQEAKGWFMHALNTPDSDVQFPGTDTPFLMKGRETEKGWEIVIQVAEYHIAKREDGSTVFMPKKDDAGNPIPLRYPDTVKDEKNDAFFEIKTEAQSAGSAARN